MQQTTLYAATFGLALAAGTLWASPADSIDHAPATLAFAQTADDRNLLAQGDWDAEEEAMLAETMLAEVLAEYE